MFKSISSLKKPQNVLASLFLILGLCGCNGSNNASNPKIDSTRLITLKGAGASFPAPLYQLWIQEYTSNKDRNNIKIAYDSVGSGSGVKNFLGENVDFGASDAPLKAEEREDFPAQRGTPIQIPMTGGLVVFAYNLSNFEGLDGIKLSRDSYCGIVTGKINRWNDAQIAKDNPNLRLPDIPILFVHRSDGSGTTFIFTNHIQNACTEWNAGAAKTVEWSVGMGAPGNEGVSTQIQQTQGAIGYIEYSYAKDNKLQMATLENKAGNFIKPSPETASQSFLGTSVPEDFALVIPDPENPQAYPIVGLTWLLVYGNYSDSMKKEVIKDFVQWSLTQGDEAASELGYLPIPNQLEEKVIAHLDTQL